MPKNMTPKSQVKIKPSFLHFWTIFNPKKYQANKYTILSFNRILRSCSNAYDCVIYLNYSEDKYLISLFAHFKDKENM